MNTDQNGLRQEAYEEPDCPLCGSRNRSVLYQRTKRSGTPLGDVTVSVSQCDDCGFVFNSPRLHERVLNEYYYSSPLASGQTFRSLSSTGYYPMLNKERAHYFASVLTHRAQGRLLDVGCGSGGFLDALKNEDIGQWELCGLEPSQHAAAVACDKGYNVECALLGHETYAPESFDAVSLVSVLEHMEHPVQTMSAIRRLLKPDGVVYVEVPSVLYPELSLTGNFSVEHILHFSPGSLTKLFHQSGFSDVMNDPLIEDFGLRLIGSRDLGAWGQTRLASYVDDPAHVRDVVTAYADAEKELIDMILRRVGKALEAWKAKGLRVAVYGAGLHTLELMSVLDLHDYCAVCLDADPKKQGTEFLGFEVHAPENLVQLGIEAVLVSSHRFQTEIEEAVRAIAGPSLEIAVCYDADYSTHCTLT